MTDVPAAIVGVPVVAAPPSAPAASTTLAITGERAACARGIEQKMLAMLSLKAPPAPDDSWKRPPMDLVACIDRSGSMRGEKMKLMKQTLDLLVRRTGLTAEDRLALVTFDSNVRCDMSLVPMSNAGRTQAEGVVRGLQPGSTTNLSGGALKAIDVLDESAGGGSRKGDKAKDEPKRTRAVMLFTDGLANEGIRDTTQLVAAVNGALAAASAKLGGPISLFTFGFGADHNEDCLRGLAAGSGAAGLYYYVESADTIPTAFADCLGGLTSVVAQNASLSLSPAPGVSVSRVLGSSYSRDAEGAVVLGDLFADDAKDVLIELSLPALPAPISAEPVLTASLRAFNVARSAPDVVEATLEVARPEATPADQPVNAALDAQRNRIETAEAMETASRMADAGDIAGGRSMLLAMKRKVAASESAQEVLCTNLMSEIDSIEAEYQDAARYRSVGSKMSKMQARSHGMQRATHANVGTYSAGGAKKAALKAHWMSSIKSSSNVGGDSDSD